MSDATAPTLSTKSLGLEIFDFKVQNITADDTTARTLNARMVVSDLEGSSMDEATDAPAVELIAWYHGFSQPAQLDRNSSSGVTTTKPSHGDFTIVKKVDIITTPLLTHLWAGKVIDKITVTLRRSATAPFFIIVMEKVLITDHLLFDLPGAVDTLEKLKFDYLKVQYNYVQKDDTDIAKGNSPVSYDKATLLTEG